MDARNDTDYMAWWSKNGSMNNPDMEYEAWGAGRSLSGLLQGCKVTHIGADSIKNGDLLVFVLDNPTSSEVSLLRDYLGGEYYKQDINIKTIVWRDTILDVKTMIKQEVVTLRDILDGILKDDLSGDNLT